MVEPADHSSGSATSDNMPPKQVTYTDSQADLTRALESVRFQWHPRNPKVTVLFFGSNGDAKSIRTVPMEHARYLWAKLLKQGWARKTA